MLRLRGASNGAWRSPVARLLWEQEVGGSNPLAPTFRINEIQGLWHAAESCL